MSEVVVADHLLHLSGKGIDVTWGEEEHVLAINCDVWDATYRSGDYRKSVRPCIKYTHWEAHYQAGNTFDVHPDGERSRMYYAFPSSYPLFLTEDYYVSACLFGIF